MLRECENPRVPAADLTEIPIPEPTASIGVPHRFDNRMDLLRNTIFLLQKGVTVHLDLIQADDIGVATL